MKKYRLLKLFSALALLGGGAFALSQVKKEAESVVADSYSGSTIIQKNDTDAKWDGCYLAGYLFDDSHSVWGPKVANTSNKYQTYSWSGLSFNPTKIIMLRVPSNWESTWDNPWWSGDGGIYARTGNVTLNSTDVIWMAGNATEGSNWGTYQVDAAVKGGASDSWSVATVDTKLTSVKVSASNALEVYGSVTLPADTYFKVVKEDKDWYGGYTADSSIQSNLSGGGANNIHNTAAATYDFYFDYDGHSIYITDPVLAAADEWAQSFLGENCTATKSGWSSSATSYAALSSGAKSLLSGQEHIDHKDSASSFVEQAVQRYDYVIERFGTNPYNDFMGRVTAGKVTPGPQGIRGSYELAQESSNLVVIVAIISVISVSTLAALIVIKKRRAVNK